MFSPVRTFVCLSATLLKKSRRDFDEICEGMGVTQKQSTLLVMMRIRIAIQDFNRILYLPLRFL